MTFSKKIGIPAVSLAILATAFLLLWANTVFGDVSYQQAGNTNNQGLYKNYNFFATSSSQLLGYGTSTPDIVGQFSATSTNIVGWANLSGQIDNGTFTIAGASQIMLLCGRGATSTNNGSTSCNYQVETQPNGTWMYVNSMTLNASTTQGVATTNLVNQIIVPSGTSTIAAILNSQSYFAVRCIVNITTDGVGFCSATARW